MTRSSASRRYLPISPFQELMLQTALDPETSQAYHQVMTVRWGFRITPSTSVRTLTRAFDKLVARHDSLRLRFVQDVCGWAAEILPKHAIGLIVVDLSNLSRTEQDAEITKTATTPKTALSETLFDLHLFKCGSQGDVIVGRAHHAIIDGFGLVVLIEDLLKFVLNIPVLQPAVTHEAFVTSQLAQIEKDREWTEAFWFERLLPPPKDPRIGRVAKGLPAASSRLSAGVLEVPTLFDESQSQHLDALAKDTGISAFSYIHAAFSDVLCDLAGQKEILINSVLGRNNPAFSSFVGAEMQEVMIRFQQDPAGLQVSAQRVQQDIMAASQAIPTDLFFSQHSRIATEARKVAGHSMRFLVHNFVPTGRLANSPFSKLFSGAMTGKVSMGFVAIERIDWPLEEQFAEIFLSVSRIGGSTNAALVAQEAAFSQIEIQEIGDAMVHKLRL